MSRNQILLIACAIALGVGIYFMPHKPTEEEKKDLSFVDLDSIVLAAKNGLGDMEKMQLFSLEKNAETNIDTVIGFCRSLRNPLLAGYWQSKKAEKQNTPENWKLAGEDFYRAVQFAHDPSKQLIMKSAIASFTNAAKLDSTDMKLKTKLGVCYVEAGVDPMKGIGLLRQVVAKDSTNIEAQLNLGFFSVTSGQFPKAIERFFKVLTIDSTYISAYVYLGDTYVRMGDKPSAIAQYEKYKTVVKDTTIQRDVEQYINQLKTNSN